jgi:hypothetical protein
MPRGLVTALTALAPSLFFAGCAVSPPEESAPPLDTEDFVEKAGTLSCTERRDTGYEAGRAFSIDVLTVDGKPVERETAEAYWKMQQAAARDGVFLRVVSGFRTQGEQQYLYGCYVHCDCNNCNLAARPGYSNHQSGYALDLNTEGAGVYTWLARNAGRFGFARTVPSEDWHWEYMGGGVGGPWPCDGAGGGTPSTPGGSAGVYTVGWGGSCWEAGQTLGCEVGALVNCSAPARDCGALWAGDRLACSAAACGGGQAPTPPGGACAVFTVPAGGSCSDAAAALGCGVNALRNTSGARSCAGLWAGDVLTCGCTPGAGSNAVGGGTPSPGGAAKTYRVPQGGSCGVAARTLGCSAASLYNCTSPESGCDELWAGDTLACRASDCR